MVPHAGASTSASPSSAPQTWVPRGALAKATCSGTSVPYNCCLCQPVCTTGTCFNCQRARREMRDVLLQTQGIAQYPGYKQPGTEQHPRREARLAVLQRWPSSATGLSINLNPFNNMFGKKKKKREKLSFCFPASSQPMPLPPLLWDCSTPPCQHPARVGMMPRAHL